MRQASFLLSAVAACALLTGTAARAQAPAPPPETTYSPLAMNAWAGISYDFIHSSGPLSASDSKAGAAFGGDLGFRFSPTFALVALGEYAPIFSSDVAGHYYTIGGGIRLQPSPVAQFLIGGGYSSLGGDFGSTSGFGVKLLGTYPIFSGFGPYLQLAYHSFSETGATLSIFTANAGLSFSY